MMFYRRQIAYKHYQTGNVSISCVNCGESCHEKIKKIKIIKKPILAKQINVRIFTLHIVFGKNLKKYLP
jgi:uncharacterized ferredoxin-like protein